MIMIHHRSQPRASSTHRWKVSDAHKFLLLVNSQRRHLPGIVRDSWGFGSFGSRAFPPTRPLVFPAQPAPPHSPQTLMDCIEFKAELDKAQELSTRPNDDATPYATKYEAREVLVRPFPA